MKTSFIFLGLLLVFAASCDPLNLGFKKNPAYVLDEAFKAVSNLDHQSFIEISGKEALCLYGNPEGITYLRERLVVNVEDVKIGHKVIEKGHAPVPEYVGFWSYYSARYVIDVHDKVTGDYLLQTVVDCHYGTDGEKSDGLLKQRPKKYKKKECRLVKIIPQRFHSLPVAQRCAALKVQLP